MLQAEVRVFFDNMNSDGSGYLSLQDFIDIFRKPQVQKDQG